MHVLLILEIKDTDEEGGRQLVVDYFPVACFTVVEISTCSRAIG